MSTTIYAGAVAPESMTFTIGTGLSELDLTDVTAISLSVSRSGNPTWTFTPAFVTQTADEIVIRRIFSANGTDVPTAGTYQVRASLTFPDGVRRAAPSSFVVVAY